MWQFHRGKKSPESLLTESITSTSSCVTFPLLVQLAESGFFKSGEGRICLGLDLTVVEGMADGVRAAAVDARETAPLRQASSLPLL